MEEKPFLILFAKNDQETIAQKVRLAREAFKVVVVDINSNDSTVYMAKVGKSRLLLADNDTDAVRKALKLLAFYPQKKTAFCSVKNYTGLLGEAMITHENTAFLKPRLSKGTIWNTALTLEKIPFITNKFSKLIKQAKRIKH